MTRLVVAGAGEMGRATLTILARRLPDAQIRVLDRRQDNIDKAIAIAPDRITGRIHDVSAGAPDLDGVDLIANFAGPFYGGSDTLARAALAARCAYVDICDDVEGIRPILALDDQAKTAGVPLITGAGNSPGSSNIMAKRLLELHPEADGIRIVWVVGDTDPGGLAPLRHMLHMAVAPCPVWRDGRFVDEPGYVPETARSYDLPDIGSTVAYNTAHSEPITLARHFPKLRYAGVQGSLLPAWSNDVFSTLGRIGFGYDDLEVEVEGQKIEPVEVLWKVLWARHERRHGDTQRGGLTIVQVQALEGDEIRATMTIVDPYSMVRTTALGASGAIIAMLDDMPLAGAWGTEILAAEKTLALIAEIAEEEGAVPGGFRLDTPVPTGSPN